MLPEPLRTLITMQQRRPRLGLSIADSAGVAARTAEEHLPGVDQAEIERYAAAGFAASYHRVRCPRSGAWATAVTLTALPGATIADDRDNSDNTDAEEEAPPPTEPPTEHLQASQTTATPTGSGFARLGQHIATARQEGSAPFLFENVSHVQSDGHCRDNERTCSHGERELEEPSECAQMYLHPHFGMYYPTAAMEHIGLHVHEFADVRIVEGMELRKVASTVVRKELWEAFFAPPDYEDGAV